MTKSRAEREKVGSQVVTYQHYTCGSCGKTACERELTGWYGVFGGIPGFGSDPGDEA